jgi:hypothetical protein
MTNKAQPLVTPRELRQATRREFGPATRDLIRQRRGSRNTQKHIDQWYGDFLKTIQGATATTATNAANVTAQQAQQAQATEDQAKAYGLAPQASPEAGQAALSRRAGADSFGALLATQGASAVNLMGTRQVAAGASRVQAHKDESAHARAIREAFGDLARNKGAFKTKYVADAEDAAWRKQLEAKGFGIDLARLEQQEREDLRDHRDAAADRRSDRTADARDVNQWGYTNAEWRAMSPEQRQRIIREQKQAGQDDGLTPAQRRENRKNSREAITRITDVIGRLGTYSGQQVQTPGTDRTHVATDKDIRDRLLREGFSSPEIHLALKIRHGRPLTRSDRIRAHRLGIIKVPRGWKHPGRADFNDQINENPGVNTGH